MNSLAALLGMIGFGDLRFDLVPRLFEGGARANESGMNAK
jgi:hypothetical protein